VFAGDSVARLAVDFGWKGVFVALAVVSALAAMAAGALLAIGTRAARRARA
jgi:sugar phosphate permease